MARVRLDQLLVTRGLARSRERARAQILAGDVSVNGQTIAKAGTLIDEQAAVVVREPEHPWVGRGGVKLAHALEKFALDVSGGTALDIGASTGGFTDVLLQRGAARVVLLLPWAVPTVVAALVWRFMFEGRTGVASALLVQTGLLDQPVTWLVGERTAWVPLVLADVWKTTPFVALLLLAGLQAIPHDLHEAARLDGAGRWRRFVAITLPLLSPTLLVAGLFRILAVPVLRMPNGGWVLASGIVSFLLGAAIWAQWPVSGVWVIGTYVGVEMLVYGISLLMLGLAVRDVGGAAERRRAA